jgi:hypothetical protein
MSNKSKIVLAVAAITVTAGVIGASIGKSIVNKHRLVGTWTFVSGLNEWGGPTLTFADDGKVKTASWLPDNAREFEGTYVVKRDTIELIVAGDVNRSEEGETGRGDGARKSGGGNGARQNTDTESNLNMRPSQPTEPKLHRLTIRSLSGTELVLADERGHKSIYAKK